MKKYDAIIIGSGQGGTPLSKKLAQAGLKTALIEKRWVGGTCVNDGCTPTKAMVASARAAWMARNASHLGVQVTGVQVDLPAIVQRTNNIVNRFRGGTQKGLDSTKNLDLVMGSAHFTGPKQLAVATGGNGHIQLEGESIFINTGTLPAIPPVKGLSEVPYLTHTTLLQLTTIPNHLVIIGGGYVGMEFGQMFARFGSKVTMVEAGSHLLPHEDRDVADCISNILKGEGIDIHCSSEAVRFRQLKQDIEVTIKNNDTEMAINCSHVLVAAGRTPQTFDLNLHLAGIQVNEKGYIATNERLETNVPGIYALGDVKGGPAFTHLAYNDHLVLYRNLVEHAGQTITGRPLPYCMFTDPQLGRIGITEDEAKRQGICYKTAIISMEKVARAIETGETRGMMKAVVDADTKKVLGAAIVGEEGGEVMTVLQMAMMGGLPYTDIRDAIIAHPLYAESLNNLFMAID